MARSLEMREPTFLILTALAPGRLHGYGIIQSVAQLSDGRVVLGPGTLYGALDRLTEEGLTQLDGEEIEAGRLRRYYKLTGAGAAAVEAEAARMVAIARRARRHLALRPAGGP
jgi:DNA-binding PadR family transcriptional regulator